MALDDFVHRNNNWRGRGRGGFRGRGRGRGRSANYQDGGGGQRQGQQVAGRGGGARPKGSAFSRIGPKIGDSNDLNGISTSDLRDKIATKVKANVIDLREKLAPKPPPPQPPRTKSYPKMSLSTARPSRSNRIPSHYAPTRLQISHSQAAQGQPPLTPPPHPRSAARSPPQQFRLPSEAEAKKITVTVPGLTKTTSEVRRTSCSIALPHMMISGPYSHLVYEYIACDINTTWHGRPMPSHVLVQVRKRRYSVGLFTSNVFVSTWCE